MKVIVGIFVLIVLCITLFGCTKMPSDARFPPNGGIMVYYYDVAPFNCNITTEGRTYMENSTHLACRCNSTDWIYYNQTGTCRI